MHAKYVRNRNKTRKKAHQEALKLRVSKRNLKPRAPRYPLPLVGAHLPLLFLPVLPTPPPLISALANASGCRRLSRVSIITFTATASWPLSRALSICLFYAIRHYSFSGAGRAWAVDPASGLVCLVAGQGAVGQGAPGAAVLRRVLFADAARFRLDPPHR